MYKAAYQYKEQVEQLGLLKLAAIFRNMAECVNKASGNQNKILYIQYYRLVNLELKETKEALKKLREERKSEFEKKQEVVAETEFVVPSRRDSNEKPRRRLSDVEKVTQIDKIKEESAAPVEKPKRQRFDLKPLPASFNFVDKIKAPYEI